jgi:nitrogen fixation NifU-like protein
MSAAVKGRSLAQVQSTIDTFKELMTGHDASLSKDEEIDEELDLRTLGELAALQGVVKFPVRIKCAMLAWNALRQGLEEFAQSPGH